MNVTSIFSALGNNSSLYPVILKDTIDNGGRVAMAYKEGGKTSKRYAIHDARERFIEENATSLIWMGGIPALKVIYDKLITNNVYKFKSPDGMGKRAFASLNINMLNEKSTQNLKKNIEELKNSAQLDKTGKLVNKNLAAIVDESEKILSNPSKFKKLTAGRMAVSTLIPLAMVGFILPKMIQKLTKKIYGKENKAIEAKRFEHMKIADNNSPVFSAFVDKSQAKQNPSFGSLGSKFIDVFNNDLCNQVILDGGIAGGRIITGKGPADKIEKGIKEAGVIFFIYLGGKIVANLLEKGAKKLGMPIALDSKILEDKNFHKQILDIAKETDGAKKEILKNQMLHFTKEADETSILKFIDKNVKNGLENNTFKNTTLKAAQKLGLVDLVEGVKNPLKQIDTNAVKGLHNSLGEFVEKALSNGSVENVEKFLKKGLYTKRASIIANLAICSLSTAYVLPKLQYFIREKITHSTRLPSLDSYDKEFAKENVKIAAKK